MTILSTTVNVCSGGYSSLLFSSKDTPIFDASGHSAVPPKSIHSLRKGLLCPAKTAQRAMQEPGLLSVPSPDSARFPERN
ncbi:hypothetical protein LTR74_018199, partial [Friedmanniomyces endolithicus]